MSSLFTSNGKVSAFKIAGQAVVLLALVAGLLTFITANKTVTVIVDGRASSVQTFGGSVADVLKAANVTADAADHVSPALDTPVEIGSTITVNTAKNVTVNLDGAQKTVTTTSKDIGGLVNQLGIAANARLSVPADALLASSDDVQIITPKAVTLIADGKTINKTSTAETVGELLADSGVSLGKSDLVSVPGVAKVVKNMVVTVSRVNTGGSVSEKSAIAFDTQESVDPNMFKGETKTLQAGVAGSLEKTFRTVTVDGKVTSRTEVGSKVLTEAVSAKISVGGKDRPVAKAPAASPSAGSGANTGAAAPAMSNEAMWDAIAQCESTGNWSINTGNGYYGGLQFDIGTWLGAGGGAYAPNASLATKSQQIAIANKVYAQRGLSPWGCAHAAG